MYVLLALRLVHIVVLLLIIAAGAMAVARYA